MSSFSALVFFNDGSSVVGSSDKRFFGSLLSVEFVFAAMLGNSSVRRSISFGPSSSVSDFFIQKKCQIFKKNPFFDLSRKVFVFSLV